MRQDISRETEQKRDSETTATIKTRGENTLSSNEIQHIEKDRGSHLMVEKRANRRVVLNEALRNELMSHILTLPLLFMHLIHRIRKVLEATIPLEPPTEKARTLNEVADVVLRLLAFPLYWHQTYTFNPLECHIISLLIFANGFSSPCSADGKCTCEWFWAKPKPLIFEWTSYALRCSGYGRTKGSCGGQA